jgi:hypothetical protein
MDELQSLITGLVPSDLDQRAAPRSKPTIMTVPSHYLHIERHCLWLTL